MADAPYLIALALVEIDGRRALPLNGRSLPAAALATADSEAAAPGDLGRDQALELLLRLLERSENGGLKRLAGSETLLLLQMPLERMSERIPVLKASWLAGGDTSVLLDGLRQIADRGWRIEAARGEAIRFPLWC